ncbi:MAG: dolichol kinase [Cyanobacteriota bacterium]|nr:dolichol kinase [Cyanobacteriota bacterium]
MPAPLLLILWFALVLALAVLVRRRWPQQREASRKLVHIGAGGLVPLAAALHIPLVQALPTALAMTVLTAINHRLRLIPAVEDVGRRSLGTVAYGASISLLLLLYWRQRPDLVVAGVLVMALGDGMAGLIGPLLPSPRWQVWGQTKSLLGTLTMAVLAVLVLRLSLPDLAWPPLLATAAAATALEQISWGGLDNLTVPLGSALLAGLLG